MLIKLSTEKTVSEAAAALQAAVEANHFGVVQVHSLKETMTKKGVEFARECLIFEVCQPPNPQETEKDLGKDLKTFEQLPAKTKELELLKDHAEKATGRESVDLNKRIRDKSK